MAENSKISYCSKTELSSIHQSLGHASLSQMGKFLNVKLNELKKILFDCLSCDKAKITQAPFKHHQEIALSCCEKIHLNLIGPINQTSKGGFQYVLTLINSHSGYLAGFPLRSKSNTADVLIFVIENQHQKTNIYPKDIVSDGIGKFVNHKLQNYNKNHHINQIVSKPYHSQHNG